MGKLESIEAKHSELDIQSAHATRCVLLKTCVSSGCT